jgi:hypothetical protein
MKWEYNKRLRDEQDLITTKSSLQDIYGSNGGGYISQGSKEALIALEKRRKLLEGREETWHQKS